MGLLVSHHTKSESKATTDNLYSQTDKHCQSGMVFAVNPPNGQFPAFQEAALSTSYTTSSNTNSRFSTARQSATTADTSQTTFVSPTYTSPASSISTTASTPSPSPSAPTVPPTGIDHPITVGGSNLLLFSPSNITAQPGDTVTFSFMQRNHSVTQSTFDTPCDPAPGGFHSGL